MDWRSKRHEPPRTHAARHAFPDMADEYHTTLPKLDGATSPKALQPTFASSGARLPGMYSPMKAGYGSGNLLAPMRRMQRSAHAKWDPSAHPGELPELRSSLGKATGLSALAEREAAAMMDQILPEPNPIERLSNVERSTMKAIQSREELIHRLEVIAAKLDEKAESTMGYLSALNPAVKMFYRLVGMLRTRTTDVIENIAAWERSSKSNSGRTRKFIWQGQDYLCKIGPDLAFLHDVYSLGTRLPRTAPEATDPFLATVTPSGVPIEEPSNTRLGSSRKGGEGARIAAARKVMRSLRGQMPWEKEQEHQEMLTHQEMLASLPGSGSRPHPGGRRQSPRTNGIKLAPLPNASSMSMSPKPPGSAELFGSPEDGMLDIDSSLMPPLPGGPSAAPTAADFSEQMVANSFASLGWPSSMPSQAAAPEERAAADALGSKESESAPVDPADVQEPDAADSGKEEEPGAPDGASAAPVEVEHKWADLYTAVAAEVDPLAGEGGEDPAAATAAMPAAVGEKDSPAALEIEKEPAESAAEAETDLADAVGAAPEVAVATTKHPSIEAEAVQKAAETPVAQAAVAVAPEPVAVDLQPIGQFIRAKIHVTEDDDEIEAHLDEEEDAGVEEGYEEEEEEEAVQVCFDFGRTSSYIDYIQRTSTAQSTNFSSFLNPEASTGFLFESTPVKVEISVSEPKKPITLELLCRPDQGPAGDATQLPSVTAEMTVDEDAETPVSLALRCVKEPSQLPSITAEMTVDEHAETPVSLALRCVEEPSQLPSVTAEMTVDEDAETPVSLALRCVEEPSQLPSVTAEMTVDEDAETPVSLALRCMEKPASGPQGATVVAKLVANEADRPVTLQLRCTEELSFTSSFIFPPSAESSELPTLASKNREAEEPSTKKTRFPPAPLNMDAPPVIVSLQVISTPKTTRTPKTARTPKAFATPNSTRSTGKGDHRPVRLELFIDSTPTPARAPRGLPSPALSPSSGQISLGLSIMDDSDRPVTVTLKSLEGVPAPGAPGPVSLSLSIAEDSEKPVTVTLKSPEATGSQGMPAHEAAGPVALSLSIAENSEKPVTAALKVPKTTGSQARAVPEAAGHVALSLSVAEGSDNPVTVTMKPLETRRSQGMPVPEAAGPVALSLSIAEGSDSPVTVTLTPTGAKESQAVAALESTGSVAMSLSIAEGSDNPVTVTLTSPSAAESQAVAALESTGSVAMSLSITEGSDNPVTVTLTSPGATESQAVAALESTGSVAMSLSIAEGSDNPVTVTLTSPGAAESQAVAALEPAGSVALSLSIAENNENPVTVTLKSPAAIAGDRAMAAPGPARDVSSSPSKEPLTAPSGSLKSTEGQGTGGPAAHVALSLSITEGTERPVAAKLKILSENATDGTEKGSHEPLSKSMSRVENVAANGPADDPEQDNEDVEAINPALESANRLLDAACAGEDLPQAARISVLHGIALLQENGLEAATSPFDESLGLHTAWAGRESLVVQVVSLFKSAASLVADGSAFTAGKAEGLIADAQAQHGPDSLAVGQVAQQLGWLLLMNEKVEDAEKFTKMAMRILRAWHGPKSSQVVVCGLLLGVIIAKEPLAEAAVRQPVDGVANSDGAVNVHGITMERAVEQAGLLLQEALHVEGGKDEDVPAIAITALLEGTARLVGEGVEQSERLMAQSSELIESWHGSLSPGIQVVRLIRGAGMLIAGKWASGYSLVAAKAALAEAAAQGGPESRSVADVAGQASWLLHLSGHCDVASDVAALARRLQHAWHGPKSAETIAAESIAKVVAADRPARNKRLSQA